MLAGSTPGMGRYLSQHSGHRPQATTQRLTRGELSLKLIYIETASSTAVYGVSKSQIDLGDSTATESLAQLKNHNRGRLVDM